MNDVALLTHAVKLNPADTTAQLALADAITERTGDYLSARVEAALTAHSAYIAANLGKANGSRRMRTLGESDVRRVIERAIEIGKWAAVGGGTVANSYAYPALQTVVFAAVRTDGTVRLAIGTVSAKKGASLTNWATGYATNAKPERFREWADAAK